MTFSHAQIIVGDNRITLAALPAGSVQTCVTSPPYWGFRDYGENDQIGIELNPEYAAISEKRITDDCGMFGTVEVLQ